MLYVFVYILVEHRGVFLAPGGEELVKYDSPKMLVGHHRGKHDADDSHELDENVECWPVCVLHWVPDGVTHHGGFVALARWENNGCTSMLSLYTIMW